MSGKKSPEEAETTTRAGDDTDAEWRNDDENRMSFGVKKLTLAAIRGMTHSMGARVLLHRY